MNSGQFKPGNSGGGRPKMPPEERAAWMALATKARGKLEAMLEDGSLPPAIVARIAEVASDMAWGKPMQAVELSGDGDNPVDIKVTFE
jgi:hypothetical protein